MTMPLTRYGNAILKEKCINITPSYPDLDQLIEEMWQTLYDLNITGLSASQVNHPVNLFVIDSNQVFIKMSNEEREKYFENSTGIIETFINTSILSKSSETWIYNEHCVSIPSIIDSIERPWRIEVVYYNKDFKKQIKSFSGLTARIIQHEYDHCRGILYIDYLSKLNRNLLKSKLIKIAAGKI